MYLDFMYGQAATSSPWLLSSFLAFLVRGGCGVEFGTLQPVIFRVAGGEEDTTYVPIRVD